MLMGRLTQDPEIRQTTTNKAVCHFRIAVKRRFTRQSEEDSDFFPVTAWEKTGEFCNNYFRKGQQVVLIGRVQNRSWNDEQNNKRNVTEIIAEEAYFAEGKRDNPSNNDIEQKYDDPDRFAPSIESDNLPF
jgi:single-strand DNA-binding protein